MSHFRVPPAVLATAVALLLAGVALHGVDWWLRPIADGEQAIGQGDDARALDRYQAAQKRFERTPLAKTLFAGSYDLVVANELSLLYALQRYDELLERAAAEEGRPAASFWAGCALFDKGLAEERPEARQGLIAQAHQEFRRALDLSANDWDTKFDYELTGRLLTGLQQRPQTAKEDLMKLLRENPHPQRAPQKKVG